MSLTPAENSPAFGAGLSTATAVRQAAAEASEQAMTALGGRRPDLAFAFLSASFAEQAEEAARELRARVQPGRLLGCTGESIVGIAREVEEGPALSLWLASLPGCRIDTMHLSFARTRDAGAFVGWPDSLPAEWPAGAAFFLLGDPFSFPADYLLERLNEDRPGTPVFGGMASGGHAPGLNRLLCDEGVYDAGAVAALVHGPVRVQAVVSQGCRPIGRHFVVTKAERNIVHELGGRPPLAQLQDMFDGLSVEDRALAVRGVHLGLVANEYQGQFARGDFLVRNVVGADRETGAIAIGDYVRVGQTVQFHVRDANTADEDLRELSGRLVGQTTGDCGALLFTCNGRGARLFDAPHHDAGVLAELLGRIPLAGFFAQGEIGPIGRKNFLHGFTASVALFTAP